MKKIIRFLSLTVLAFLFAANVSILGAAQAQTQTPKASVPILLTSCGQSPGPVMLKVFFQKLSLNFDFNVLATAKDIKAKKDAGTPYKSLIVVMGASLKGMGAAGISIEDELKRTAELIDAAKREKITVIGAHIEGMKRRAQGAEAGDTTDEQSIDAVAPKSDMLLINKEGNSDGRFSIIAKEKKIPMIEVEKNLDLLKELEKLFK